MQSIMLKRNSDINFENLRNTDFYWAVKLDYRIQNVPCLTLQVREEPTISIFSVGELFTV